MASKRMFSVEIVETDRFLDLPASSQALYFHLGMNADDDGFVASPKKIMRSLSCSEDDMKLLYAKNFVIPFNSGIVVITDWKVNNSIKSDRYHPTIHQDEKSLLSEVDRRYFLAGSKMVPELIHNGSKLDPQTRKEKYS